MFYSSGSPQYEDLWFDLTERDDVEITPESGISEEFRVFLVRMDEGKEGRERGISESSKI